jgi:glycosyltransferase involved in cell wall biosynthesis
VDNEPLVSVVISTYNRPDRLAGLLRSLRAQTLEHSRFAVVVVDNGSGAETAKVLALERDRGELALTCERLPVTLGPAGGRNAGWRLARTRLVAFTDDDCVPAAGWLEALLACEGAHPGAIVQGPTRPDPAERHRQGLLTHSVSIERLGPQYETCNIAYPRDVLETLDGFDESFGLRPAGEDTDLAWRAIEAGREVVFAPDAVVYHCVEPIGARGMLRLAARWGPAVRVLRDHPATRSMLYRGLFWNVWHYLLWRSLLALAAPSWLRRLVLARHLAQLRARAAEVGASGAAVPFLLVHDAVECAAVAGGALRHRVWAL